MDQEEGLEGDHACLRAVRRLRNRFLRGPGDRDVLPECYLRQAVDQLFDNILATPTRCFMRNRNMETIKGHMLPSFVATFLYVASGNRIGVTDTRHGIVSPARGRPCRDRRRAGGGRAARREDADACRAGPRGGGARVLDGVRALQPAVAVGVGLQRRYSLSRPGQGGAGGPRGVRVQVAGQVLRARQKEAFGEGERDCHIRPRPYVRAKVKGAN